MAVGWQSWDLFLPPFCNLGCPRMSYPPCEALAGHAGNSIPRTFPGTAGRRVGPERGTRVQGASLWGPLPFPAGALGERAPR